MKTGHKAIPLVEENYNKSKNNIKQNSNINNKDIIIGLPKNKCEEDEKSTHSADFSGNELKENQNPNIPKQGSYPLSLTQKEIERYNEKLKEKTMRIEIDKRSNETERLKNKFEERNSHLHSFDNNPQYQKMLKRVSFQLFLIFIGGNIYFFYSLIIYLNTNKKETLALFGMCLSISAFAFVVILFIALNIGLLNDPNLSRTFRLFIIIETTIFFCNFVFNIILAFMSKKYLRKIKHFKNKFFIYFLFVLMIIFTLIIIKFCKDLFIESFLILLGKKTEYSVLIIKEQNLKNNEINFNTNLSVSDNNMTNENLTNSVSLFNNEENKEKDKEEEQYRAFNYYNRFHYSVSSSRKNDFHSFKKN